MCFLSIALQRKARITSNIHSRYTQNPNPNVVYFVIVAISSFEWMHWTFYSKYSETNTKTKTQIFKTFARNDFKLNGISGSSQTLCECECFFFSSSSYFWIVSHIHYRSTHTMFVYSLVQCSTVFTDATTCLASFFSSMCFRIKKKHPSDCRFHPQNLI